MKVFTEPSDYQDIDVKIQSKKKMKRLGLAPGSYEDLRAKVEAQIAEERPIYGSPEFASAKKDYTIRYEDGDKELVNVSDDEDLQAAYKVARRQLGNSLKFLVSFKKPAKVSKQEEPVEKLSHDEKALAKAAKKVVKDALKEEKKK